jgi:hypothetical protein
MSAFSAGESPIVQPTGIIAQPVHLRTGRPDQMQQIWRRDVAPMFFDQRGLAVLARAPAL